MSGLLPPEQLAEATAPTIHDRFASALVDLANIVENAPVAMVADDAVYGQAQRLSYWLVVQLEAAGAQRAGEGRPVAVWEPPELDGPLTGG